MPVALASAGRRGGPRTPRRRGLGLWGATPRVMTATTATRRTPGPPDRATSTIRSMTCTPSGRARRGARPTPRSSTPRPCRTPAPTPSSARDRGCATTTTTPAAATPSLPTRSRCTTGSCRQNGTRGRLTPRCVGAGAALDRRHLPPTVRRALRAASQLLRRACGVLYLTPSCLVSARVRFVPHCASPNDAGIQRRAGRPRRASAPNSTGKTMWAPQSNSLASPASTRRPKPVSVFARGPCE